MRLLFILRSEFGTSGAAASYMIPTIAHSKYKYDVSVISISREKEKTSQSFRNASLKTEACYVASIDEEVNLAIEKVKSISPDVVYIMGRPDPFPMIYNIRHSFPFINLIYDVRSPLLSLDPNRKNELGNQYRLMQPYLNLMLASDVGAAQSYFEPDKYNFDILPIGVDTKNIVTKQSYSERISRFVFVGSLEKKRKLQSLIRGFADFSKEISWPVTLDIVGDGASKKMLEDLASSIDGGECIKFKGFLPQREIFSILYKYDCGIAYVPYERYDNAPSLKSIEYAAAKIPVLASDTTAHKRYKAEHGFSFNFFSNDSTLMADDFLAFSSKNITEKSIEKSYLSALQFDWVNLFDKVIQPFLKSLNNRNFKE